MEKLTAFEKNNTVDVLMVIEGEIATTHLIELILNACAPHGICYRKRFLLELTIRDFHPKTVPLFVRCGDPATKWWTGLLHRAGHPYLYYIDDNFWRIPGDSPVAQYYRRPSIRKSLEKTITRAAGVLTNSEVLASFLSKFNGNIIVLPAFFDFSLIEGAVGQPSDEVRIGFSGSTSRTEDLDIIRPVIFPILERFPNAVFEFAGAMPRYIKRGRRIRFFPYTDDYKAYIRFQAERNWAVGLAPLIDNESNRCKTNNKYREYGACKTAGIYSNMPPYNSSISSDNTGLLVDNTTEAWFSAVEYLLEDPHRRKKIADSAYLDVREKYSVERVACEWSDCFAGVNHHLHLHPVASLHGLPIRRLKFHLDQILMQILETHREGGTPLVLRRSKQRITQSVYSLVKKRE